jgi:hypothetical protein
MEVFCNAHAHRAYADDACNWSVHKKWKFVNWDREIKPAAGNGKASARQSLPAPSGFAAMTL